MILVSKSSDRSAPVRHRPMVAVVAAALCLAFAAGDGDIEGRLASQVENGGNAFAAAETLPETEKLPESGEDQ